MRRKSRDLYETSGSAWRVIRYNALYGWQKFPRALWRKVAAQGRQWKAGASRKTSDAEVDKLALCVRGGGFGDHLVTARFLRDLHRAFNSVRIDVYSSDPIACRWILGSVVGVDRCLDEAALGLDEAAVVLDVIQYPVVVRRDPHSRTARALEPLLDAVEAFGKMHAAEIARRPYFDGYLAQKATFSNRTRANALQAICGIDYGGDRLRLAIDEGALDRFALTGRSYLTIHNGFDPNFVISGRQSSKCYPHFDSVVARLRTAHPEIAVVLLGLRSSQAIAGSSIDLRGRTSLPEVAAILAGSRLHIGNEGGLVHLAACVGTRSCVLFGPTPADYFGYPNNLNLRPTTCGGCWWVNDSWMDQCARGFAEPACLSTQRPDVVARAISEVLAVNATTASSAPD